MPVESIVVLAIIVSAFVIFAGALAWADAQTRNLTRPASAAPPAEDRKAA